jgi:hypothetical protein
MKKQAIENPSTAVVFRICIGLPPHLRLGALLRSEITTPLDFIPDLTSTPVIRQLSSWIRSDVVANDNQYPGPKE